MDGRSDHYTADGRLLDEPEEEWPESIEDEVVRLRTLNGALVDWAVERQRLQAENARLRTAAQSLVDTWNNHHAIFREMAALQIALGSGGEDE